LDWFKKNRPSFLRQLRKLVQKGQVEIMGGAYYEAILSIIPDEDKKGQLEKLSEETNMLFGKRPAGMWLAERVWEQHLTKYIVDAGLHFIAVDDTHFKHAGLSEYELLGYYATEEQGRRLAIFPISKKLRYNIPFQTVQKTIDYLREIATEEGDRVVVYADDGEKFGVWPKTYEHVYGKGWLEDFFKALEENGEWIRMRHFSEVVQEIPPLGRIYLPNASYAEMMQWVMRPRHVGQYEEIEKELIQQGKLERFEPFLKGGFWRNFLVKYPEINSMHKKMLRVSNRAYRLLANGTPQRKLKTVFDHLWASQCNDSYWHGVFGGFYLPVLRYPVYQNLISAESALDVLEKQKSVNVTATDFDCDGRQEVLVETPALNCYFKPDQGGSVFELDFKAISLNLLDIVSRREEAYHKKLSQAGTGQGSPGGAESIHDIVLAKETGLERYLHYDWYRHGSLIDHFFGSTTTLQQLQSSNYPELGSFVNQPYSYRSIRKKGVETVELKRRAMVWHGDREHRVEVSKQISFRANDTKLAIEYTLKNLDQSPLDVWFGVEFNIGLQAGDAYDRYYYSDEQKIGDRKLASSGELHQLRVLGLRDEWLGVDVRIESDIPATFWRFPIETISLSEEGFERIFQSSVVVPSWRFRLANEWRLKLVHSFFRLK
jgi:alpha-amylase